MKKYKQISPAKLNVNPFTLIGEEWMLVSASKPDGSVNFMTASWGGMGVLWGKNVCFIFVRPSRYTYEFTEASDNITLSFFSRDYRSMLNYCGTKSGRDVDKAAACGLHVSQKNGFVCFDEAKTEIFTKKLYASQFEEKYFTVNPPADATGNLHKMYICEITGIETEE